ncbi:hypothetical protein JCM17380_23680 [Desulfosporosinus burensis]
MDLNVLMGLEKNILSTRKNSKEKWAIMKKKSKLVSKPRTRSLFNTGTRPHKSNKDYTRKIKYKQTTSEDGEQ